MFGRTEKNWDKQDRWCKGQDYNPVPPDHEARMLLSTHDACVEKNVVT
jgi:hypothetical protein